MGATKVPSGRHETMFFCKESEGLVNIDVVRFGGASEAASVQYYTQDSSAKAGKKYVARSGIVISFFLKFRWHVFACSAN